MKGRPSAWLSVLATFLVQLFVQAHFFPISELGSDKPLIRIDSPFHQYQMAATSGLCAEGRLGGYDPRLAAGSYVSLATNASAKPQAALACLFAPRWSVVSIYKAVSFVQALVAPACIAVAAWALGLGASATLVAGLLAVVMWWTGGVRWYYSAGMVEYVFAAFLVLPFLVLVRNRVSQPSLVGTLAVGFMAAVATFVHPLFPLAATLAGSVWIALEATAAKRWTVALSVTAVALITILGLNAWWLREAFAPLTAAYPQPYQREVAPLLAFTELAGKAATAGGGTRLGAALIGLCILAIRLDRTPARRALIGLAAGAALVMAWASVGALSSAIALLQPNRFSTLAWILLVIPAARGLELGCRALMDRTTSHPRAVAAAILVLLLPVAYMAIEAGNEVFGDSARPRYAVSPPEVKGFGPVTEAARTMIQQHTDRSGRILFEMSLARVHDGAHIAGWLAHLVDREFIGGPYPYFDYAGIWDGFAFGRRLADISPNELRSLLDTYNVRWMICHSSACKGAMARLSDATQISDQHGLTMFGRASAPGWVVQGDAVWKSSCLNRVEFEVRGASAVVLKYHWLPGLKAYPGGVVEPTELLPGARPFVRLRGATGLTSLQLGDGSGLPCDARR